MMAVTALISRGYSQQRIEEALLAVFGTVAVAIVIVGYLFNAIF
jgi:hypothetical protein